MAMMEAAIPERITDEVAQALYSARYDDGRTAWEALPVGMKMTLRGDALIAVAATMRAFGIMLVERASLEAGDEMQMALPSLAH